LSQKGYEAKLSHFINQRKLPLFDANTQCLMRQAIWLLSEKLKVINIIHFFFNFFFFMPKLFL
jgi:hypothetical protein